MSPLWQNGRWSDDAAPKQQGFTLKDLWAEAYAPPEYDIVRQAYIFEVVNGPLKGVRHMIGEWQLAHALKTFPCKVYVRGAVYYLRTSRVNGVLYLSDVYPT